MRPSRTLLVPMVTLALAMLGGAAALGCRGESSESSSDRPDPPIAGTADPPSSTQVGSGAQPGTDAAALPPSAFGGGPLAGSTEAAPDGAPSTGDEPSSPRPGSTPTAGGAASKDGGGASAPAKTNFGGTSPGFAPLPGVHRPTSGPPMGPSTTQRRGPPMMPTL